MSKFVKLSEEAYKFEGKLSLSSAIPLGLQHVLAMFVGNLTPVLIIGGACGIVGGAGFEQLQVVLIQNAMIVAGLVTLLQLYSVGPCGGKVPIIMGTSSGFIGVFAGIVATLGSGVVAYGAIMGASIIGGVFEAVLGLVLKRIRRFFPPVVCGTVVLSIGLSLISVGINSFGGGFKTKDFGSIENLLLGLFVLCVILFFKHGTKGFLSSSSILLGIIAGYIAAIFMGFVFDMRAIMPVLIMFVVTAVETVGDISAVVESGLNREATDKELSGGVICDGIGSAIAAVFGVLPNTSFSQNVGLVAMTKIVNRFALATGAVFLILCGLIPKLGALVSIMPQSVLGGAAVMMFSSIVVSGIQLVTKEKLNPRSLTIISVALGVGYGMGATPGILAHCPEAMRMMFGESGIVPAAFVAILLNIILNRGEDAQA